MTTSDDDDGQRLDRGDARDRTGSQHLIAIDQHLSWAATARIALAVFAGTLLALAVAGFALRLYVGHIASNALDGFVGTDPSDLSQGCEDALKRVAGRTITAVPPACRDDDQDVVTQRMADLQVSL